MPEYLESCVSVGVFVVVPFGKSNAQRVGVIFAVRTVDEIDESIKEICTVSDTVPALTDEMICLSRYMKDNYYCTWFDGIRAMVPLSSRIKTDAVLRFNESRFMNLQNSLTLEEKSLALRIRNEKRQIKGRILSNLASNYGSLIERLKILGILYIEQKARKIAYRRSILYIRLNPAVNFDIRFTVKQRKVIDFIKQRGISTVKDICYFTGESKNVVNNLINKKVLVCSEKEEPKSSQICETIKSRENINLSDSQRVVFQELKSLIVEDKPHVSLLHGITGSGKTMVMLAIIDFVVKRGKSAIFMVPEIALTSQFVDLFKVHYGDTVAILHSGLPDKERLSEWDRVKNGFARVVIGTRTAVFAPVKDLGLIVMDEEHESTYKSEASPRFHARDIAVQRCKYNKCMLLLASATPSIESYFCAKVGKYSLHKLDKRYGNAVLPVTETVDMNDELVKGNPTPFSERLIEVIKEEKKAGKQAILLLNRRGYNTFVRCRSCREPVICPNCNITMNYHRANNRLMCHYCGHSMDFLQKCPKCHGENISYEGIGTQRAQFQLEELIPDAKILRVDADSVDEIDSHEKMFRDFSEGKYDIMIGTQMVAKGLNFPNVTVVGVLMADQSLYSDDFRSYERTFSLITQVSGRSGRGQARGKSVIQTYTPENTIIDLAAAQDYESFYSEEIKIRKAMLYPPFSDLCYVGFKGKEEKNTKLVSNEFFNKLKDIASSKYKNIPLRIFRPCPANVDKVCGNYRYRILIKFKNSKDFRGMMSEIMLLYERRANSKQVDIFIDVNPMFIW